VIEKLDLSGNALILINELTLYWAQLVLWWVIVCRQINHLVMIPATQFMIRPN